MKLPKTGLHWYFLFWPLFVLRYLLIEQYRPEAGYHLVFCCLDGRIPFCELFFIPYIGWYGCIIGMHVWLYGHEKVLFRQYSRFLIITMSVSTFVFLIWPSRQNLRPAVFPRDNVLTGAVQLLYQIDTSTNVLPSEHVIGSAAVFLAALRSRQLNAPGKRIPIVISSVLTAASTVFLKQHSLLDVAAAIPVCVIGGLLSFSCDRLSLVLRGRPVQSVAGKQEQDIRFPEG